MKVLLHRHPAISHLPQAEGDPELFQQGELQLGTRLQWLIRWLHRQYPIHLSHRHLQRLSSYRAQPLMITADPKREKQKQ